MYSQVVVPLDGGPFSRRAIGPALRVATASDADVLLVSYAHTETHRRDLEALAAEDVAALAPRKVRSKVEVVDDVAAAIVSEVEAVPGSIVVMSSVGRPRSEPLLGSVAESVLRHVSTPVLLVGPSVDVNRFRLEGVMEIAVDDSGVSESILPVAAGWSIVFHLGLRVVTVLSAARTDSVPGESWTESAYVRRVAGTLRSDVDCPVDFDVLHGNVAECIIEDAGRYANLIAVSTHGRTGLHRVAAGSVAMAVVHGSTVPVLVYRPLQLRH
jgi:nucleotide-binding universal stress UspA family protein